MVGQRILTPSIQVRVLVSQPFMVLLINWQIKPTILKNHGAYIYERKNFELLTPDEVKNIV